MSSALAMPRTGFKIMLIVKEGPDSGTGYQLLPPRVTIGRGAENNIALNDARVSRQAAVIEFSMEEITITDVSSRNNLFVNGELMISSPLRDGDRIRMGDTELIFRVEALPMVTHAPGVHRPQLPGSGGPGPAGIHAPPPRMQRNDGGKKVRFYIIAGIIVGTMVWLINEEESAKPKEASLRTVEQIEKELEGSEKRQEALIKEREFKSDEERTRFREAQRHFMEGFRDYQKGQWVRALRSFETARAIDTKHELAGRYYRLAEKQRDEMVAFLTLEGRRYKEKSMYARCSASFSKVLDAIPNKNDVKYKEAEALKKECDLLIDERFK